MWLLEKNKESFFYLIFFYFQKNRSIPRPPIDAREKGRDLSNNPLTTDNVYKIEM